MTFVQVTDSHVGSAGASRDDPSTRFAAMVDDINSEYGDAAFVVHTGDIGGMAGEAEAYQAYHDLASRLNLPIHYTLGNHDNRAWFRRFVTKDSGRSAGSEADDAPWHWAFDMGSWSFVGVDSSDGALPKSEIEWLDAALGKTPRPTFLFLHHNPLLLLALLQVHPQVRGVAFGHMHLTRTLYLEGTHFYCTSSPAFALSLVPAEKMVTDSEASYRVFRIEADGSIETLIRHVDVA